MFDIIFAEQSGKKNFFERIDPRVKLSLLLLFIIVLMSSSVYQPSRIIILSITLLLFLIYSQLPIKSILNILLKFYPMILVISIFQILSIELNVSSPPGDGFTIFDSEILITILMFQSKVILLILASLIFIGSTPFLGLFKVLEKMHIPNIFMIIFFFIYRFVFILSFEIHRIAISYKSRYVKLPFFTQLRMMGKLSAVYMIRLFDRGDRFYYALLSRGFRGELSFEFPIRWKQSDTWMLITGASFILVIPIFI